MSTRGRRAARPAGTHRRPAPLSPGGLVVEHRDRHGLVRRYDFAALRVPPTMQRSWAALFAGACAPGGGWDSRETSADNFNRLTRFAAFLARQDDPPGDVTGLTPAHWAAWRVSRPATTHGYADVTKVAAFLRRDPRLRPDTRAAMAKRLAVAKPRETAFTEAEFLEIRTVARRMFRSAHQRIAENSRVLEAWRAGALEPGTGQWLLGEALDVLARTGDVPRYASGRIIHRYQRPLGGESLRAARERLYLNKMEAASLAVLLAVEFGLNATTISEMPAPRATPDSGEGGTPTYRVELEKRRRGSGRHFETRNITDLGPGTPAHHPRLAVLHQALDALIGVLDPAAWDEDWGDAHARLADLRQRLGEPAWRGAAGRATASDRDMINDLLNGNYDL